VPPRYRRCGRVGEGGRCRLRAGWRVGGRRKILRRGFLGVGLRLLRRRMGCGKCRLGFLLVLEAGNVTFICHASSYFDFSSFVQNTVCKCSELLTDDTNALPKYAHITFFEYFQGLIQWKLAAVFRLPRHKQLHDSEPLLGPFLQRRRVEMLLTCLKQGVVIEHQDEARAFSTAR
jgi:hypothetical protein